MSDDYDRLPRLYRAWDARRGRFKWVVSEQAQAAWTGSLIGDRMHWFWARVFANQLNEKEYGPFKI